jgi:hypothetical protein
MTNVIQLKMHQDFHCLEVPASERCTDRLYECRCPGQVEGRCASPKFDETKHNVELPKFFAAQH